MNWVSSRAIIIYNNKLLYITLHINVNGKQADRKGQDGQKWISFMGEKKNQKSIR